MFLHSIPSASRQPILEGLYFHVKECFSHSQLSVIFAKVNVSAEMLIGMFTQPGNTLKLKTYFSDAIK